MNTLERIANTATNIIWGLSAPRRLTSSQIANAKLVAHRGVHENGAAIENSRESFNLALQMKLWGIEFDVRFTKDNIPVIHHDPHCKRLYDCDSIIEETDFAELNHRVPQIPTLKEVVEKFGGKIHLLIEIKENVTAQQDQILLEVLRPLKPEVDYHLLTLNTDHFDDVTFAPRKAMMAVDWMDMENTIERADAREMGAVSGHFMLLDDERLAKCKAHGLTTGTGFIETKGCLYREINRGIDWIFTNHPVRLKAYLA
jgi:glycerophosphoryl diester phosphodiesterase